jgi:hypothetical protein
MKGLIYAGLAACVAGFCVDLYWTIAVGTSYAADPVYPIIQYVLYYFITITLFVILLSILINSYYQVDEKNFVTSFGLIKSKYPVDQIELCTLDRTTNKLTVTFLNSEYIVIVVKQDWYNEFIEALLAANRKIEYSIISKEDEKDKK